MSIHSSKMRLGVAALIACAVSLFGCEEHSTDPGEASFAKGGNKGGAKEVMVEFKRPQSGELGGFFGTATLDYGSEPQPLQGNHGTRSIQTKYTTFTLGFESMADFYDGRSSSESCETGFLETIVNAAAANQGSLDGSLNVEASWDEQQEGALITVRFIVAVDPWEYAIRLPGLSEPGENTLIQTNDERTILAIRNGHFSISRRELGRKGTWWALERCLTTPSNENGFMDAEIWVWK